MKKLTSRIGTAAGLELDDFNVGFNATHRMGRWGA